jgi:hypothetical protein
VPRTALMDPDPGGPKTYGSGSATLISEDPQIHLLKNDYRVF